MKNIHRLELPTQFGMKTVNSFLIKGDENVLIDCGEDSDESLSALKGHLKDHHLDFSDIDRIILTHAHVDHMGMAERVSTLANCEVWTSELVEPWALDPDTMWSTRESLMLPFLMSFFDEATLSVIQGGYMQMMGNVRKAWKPISKDKIKTFESEGFLEIDGHMWDVVYMPGHSATQSTFYHSPSTSYFSADMLLRITPTPVIEPSLENPKERERGIIKMLESYERLSKMDIGRVYPGHYDIFENHQAVIDRQVKRIHQRSEECLNIIKGGTNSFLEIFNVLYEGRFHMPALIMLIGYLDLLEEKGLIQQIPGEIGKGTKIILS